MAKLVLLIVPIRAPTTVFAGWRKLAERDMEPTNICEYAREAEEANRAGEAADCAKQTDKNPQFNEWGVVTSGA